MRKHYSFPGRGQHETWFKAMRSDDAFGLLQASNKAFVLLFVIAARAQRTTAFNRYNLKPGEALIGDCKSCGMTAREYRTAKELLAKWQFATFKATSRGTIATLLGTRVFDINSERSDKPTDKQATSNRQTSDKQATTTKNDNNVNKAEESLVKKKPSLQAVIDFALSENLPTSEAQPFLDHHEAVGWRIGNSPVADWRAAFRCWVRKAATKPVANAYLHRARAAISERADHDRF